MLPTVKVVRNKDTQGSKHPTKGLDAGCQRREAPGWSPVSGLSNLKNSVALLDRTETPGGQCVDAALQRAKKHGSHSCLCKYLQ